MKFPPFGQFSSNLELALQKELPAWEAQKLMSSSNNRHLEIKEDHLKASVVALISEIDHVPAITYIKRASHYEGDKHKGQISFPGGKQEVGETALQCAMRETAEEISVNPMDYTVIGQLSPLYIDVSNFYITPFVGIANNEFNFVLDETEVDTVYQWKLTDLQNNIFTKDITVRGYTLKNVPYYGIDDEVLWGATAMMTSELLHIINQIS